MLKALTKEAKKMKAKREQAKASRSRQTVNLPVDCWALVDMARKEMSQEHGIPMSRSAILAMLVRGGIR